MSSVTEPLGAEAFSFTPLEAPPDLSVPIERRLREADDVLSRARAEADAIREQAKLEGHQEGLQQGREEALAAGQPAAAALREAAVALAAEADRIAAELERGAVELGLRIAEQALGAAVAVEPERVLDVVRGALRRLVERERVLLLVHPDDLDLVRDGIAGLVGELGGIEHCEVQAERRVARGGAIVQTREGEVDAALATKLERAREAIEHELRGDR